MFFLPRIGENHTIQFSLVQFNLNGSASHRPLGQHLQEEGGGGKPQMAGANGQTNKQTININKKNRFFSDRTAQKTMIFREKQFFFRENRPEDVRKTFRKRPETSETRPKHVRKPPKHVRKTSEKRPKKVRKTIRNRLQNQYIAEKKQLILTKKTDFLAIGRPRKP